MVSKMKTRHGSSGTKPEKENDEGGVASYELLREQRIKENFERMQKLGILELSRNLKPTKPKIILPPKQKPLPPSPNSQRRSSRIQTLPTVDYTPKRVFKNEVIEDVKVEIRSCHQCRQKTTGHHTKCCKCKTDQGQFCGRCLFTRYGENVVEVIENPNWVCPVCRDICNCCRCRRLKGWEPTGNLYRKALRLGFKSVAHYLIQMQRPNGKLDDMDNKTLDEEDDDQLDVLTEKDVKHEHHSQQCKGEDGDDDSVYKSDPLDDDDDDDDDYKSDPLDDDDDDDDDSSSEEND